MDPPFDPDDPEVRPGPFHWLDDPDRGACFPNSVRRLPIITAGGSSLSWQQWQQGQAGGANAELVERTIAAASRDQCQLAFDNLSQALVELRQLTQFLSSKLGPEAPGFTALRPAIEESRRLAQQILQKKGPAAGSAAALVPDEAMAAIAAGSDGATSSAATNVGYAASRPRYGTREDIYKELATAADALERLEPHSPVPFLVRRAVELGAPAIPPVDASPDPRRRRPVGNESRIGNQAGGRMKKRGHSTFSRSRPTLVASGIPAGLINNFHEPIK